MSLANPAALGVAPASSGATREEQYRWLLLLRFVLLNLTALALVLAVWAQGWLDGMIATDRYHLVKLNVCVFLAGMMLCALRLSGLSRELNELSRPLPEPDSRVGHYLREIRGAPPASRGLLADALKMKLGIEAGHDPPRRHHASC